MALTPIPLTRLAPLAASASRVSKPSSPLAPKTTTVLEPAGVSSEHLREEFEGLSLKLRLHENKTTIMEPSVYTKTLQRALDIVTLLNQTTAGPKAANKKIGVAKQSPKSLADL